MAQNTWNFACWAPRDHGPDNPPRQRSGTVFECGIGAQTSTSQPFTESMTSIFSIFIRPGWTSQDDGFQGIFSIAQIGAFEAVRHAFINSLTSPAVQIRFKDAASNTARYFVNIGDEDGINWLQDSKWYQVAVSVDNSNFTFAMNGSTSPKTSTITNVPGALNIDFGSERIWMTGPTAAWGSQTPLFVNHSYPTVILGAAAHSTKVLDLSSSTVRDRIWDSNGDFKNPGADGSLWFGDTYGEFTPEYYFANGVPIHQRGSDPVVWVFQPGGLEPSETPPGGCRKQYES